MSAIPPYAQALGDRPPLEVLVETEKSIAAVAQELGPEGLKRTYAPGKWSASQILAHLADCELGFGYRVRQIVSEPELPIQPFDQDRWAQRYDRMDGLEAARTFQVVRAWNVALFRLLGSDDLAKSAIHPERGPETVDTVIRIMAGHTLHHLAQLEKILHPRSA